MVMINPEWVQGLKRALSQRKMDHHAVDYLDVDELPGLKDHPRSWLLKVHFLIPEGETSLLARIGPEHIRVTPLLEISFSVMKVEEVYPDPDCPETSLHIVLREPSEKRPVHSLYQLRIDGLRFIDENLNGGTFSVVDEDGTAIDPRQPAPPEKEVVAPIAIDYLGRDFEAFRRQILERLTTTLPTWEGRSPADPGIALVELLAHAADVHSYHQDAVATESYLNTARRRISVRRHARLLDYYLGEGSNARCWVFFEIQGDPLSLAQGTQLFTESERVPTSVIYEESLAYERVLEEGGRVFETMHEGLFREEHNRIRIYCWENREYILAKGAVSAVLIGEYPHITAGSPLLLEQYRDPETGRPGDVDPRKRIVVRVKLVRNLPSPTGTTPLTYVEWHGDDALTFDLIVTSKAMGTLGLVRANMVLADSGRTRLPIQLPPVQQGNRYRPRIPQADITYRPPYDHNDIIQKAAAKVLKPDPRRAMPVIELIETNPLGQTIEPAWEVRRDLLSSTAFDRHFVLETDSDRTAILRFGDGHQGWMPDEGHTFRLTFRTGVGIQGNVGADTVRHVVLAQDQQELSRRIISLRNPLPAEGGLNPESLERARLAAPNTFKTQARCITEDDYAQRVAAHHEVQNAVARRVWTGSQYTLFIYVDRLGGKPVDRDFSERIDAWVHQTRMLGDQVQVVSPKLVALEIKLALQTLPGHVPNVVHTRLARDLGIGYRQDGGLAFFHPDRLTFGEHIFLADILGEIADVPGVAQIVPKVFRRMDRPGAESLRFGRIDIGPTEIASVQNDANAPELGYLVMLTYEDAT